MTMVYAYNAFYTNTSKISSGSLVQSWPNIKYTILANGGTIQGNHEKNTILLNSTPVRKDSILEVRPGLTFLGPRYEIFGPRCDQSARMTGIN